MSIAALLGAATGLYVLGMSFLPETAQSSLLYMPALFLNGVAQGGTRLGRKTYLVDYAPDDKRALYVGVSNSIVGVFTLAGALFGAVAQVASVDAAVALLIAALIAAALLARRLTPTGATPA
jgi:sugar phosphate permease